MLRWRQLIDGDDLPDIEEQGYRDQHGNLCSSDPNNADTDGDGLTDDYKAGELITDTNGHTYQKARSNPLKADSDDDELGDYIEDKIGTDPLNPDTDNDGIIDSKDTEPLLTETQLNDIKIREAIRHSWRDFRRVRHQRRIHELVCRR